MKVYLVYTQAYENLLRQENARLLVSYARLRASPTGGTIPTDFDSILIDSGVYNLQHGTGTSQSISLSGYSTWLQLNLGAHPEIDGYIAYDWGEGKQGAEESKYLLENYQRMLAEGLHPIPVWHPNAEDWDRLEYYASTSEYIALGGLVVLRQITGAASLLVAVKQRYPSHRIHMLGVGHSLLNRIPSSLQPASVDVSTWTVPARFGHVLIRDEKGMIVEKSDRITELDGKVFARHLSGGKKNPEMMSALRSSIKTLMSMEVNYSGNSQVQPILF